MAVTFWKGRRVLITGHTGFKGSWLSLWLRRAGAEVTGYALAPSTTPNHYDIADAGREIRSIFADIRDGGRLREAFAAARPEVVFHLAAQSLVRQSFETPYETYETNVLGTVNLLEAARSANSVRAIVVVTSDKCYENREWTWPYRENDPLGGFDPYSSSKACAEIVTAAYRRSFLSGANAARVATARAGNVIGGGDWSRDRLLPDLIAAFASRTVPLIRNPHATRPWQFVLDALSGYLLLAERLCGEDGDAFAEAWNFGPQNADVRSVKLIADRAAALWGDGARYDLDTRSHPHEARSLTLDSSKARARLGWSSRIDPDMALEWTVRWYRGWASSPASVAERSRSDIEAYSALCDQHASLPLL